MWSLTVVTEPTLEPVSLSEAKAHLRVDAGDEDTYIESLITAARQHVESFTARALMRQTLKLTLDDFPSSTAVIDLPRPPLVSVSEVAYVDTDGVDQTVASSDYRVDITSEPGRIEPAYGETWPTVRDEIAAVNITYLAGASSSGDVLAPLRHAILLLVGHWFEHREQVVVGTIVSTLPTAVEALLWPHRILTF